MSSGPKVLFPVTRREALERLADFLPHAGAYAARRNYVEIGHENVTRLSPATRTRMLLEPQICSAARRFHPVFALERFEREIWWRLYWKGWLEMRPGVWQEYRRNLAGLEWSERARRVAAGESGVAIMDSFARELLDVGYLHNHARMWWAAFWIHVERLPWQLGADFFLRHLIDGDAAANTLSWRWVAGLHTRGKTYLVRRSNVEKYVCGERLDGARAGLERLERPAAIDLPFEEPPGAVPIRQDPDWSLNDSGAGTWGLWLHDEDLLLEESPLARLRPSSVAAPLPTGIWKDHGFGNAKRKFLRAATADGAQRAGAHFAVAPVIRDAESLPGVIANWAREAGINTVAAVRPCVGPLADQIDAVRAELEAEGVRLVLVRRAEEVGIMNQATAGFFGFWKKSASRREEAVASAGDPLAD